MPNFTATQVPFAKLGRREIDVRFDGGDVTSDGGFLFAAIGRAAARLAQGSSANAA